MSGLYQNTRRLILTAIAAAAATTAGNLAAAVTSIKADLSASNGDARIGVTAKATGSPTRTQRDKNREWITLTDLGAVEGGDLAPAFLRAAAEGVRSLRANVSGTLAQSIALWPNLLIQADPGVVVTVPAGTAIPNGLGVFDGNGKANITLVRLAVDASASAGLPGLRLVGCPGVRVTDLSLLKCAVQVHGGVAKNKTLFERPNIDMQGYATTAMYLSGADGVTITDPDCCNGLEGIVTYNACRRIKVKGGELHHFTGDGFMNVSGQVVDVEGTESHHNGQSGFTTHRMTSATDTRFVTFRGTKAYANGYDGFDIRGGNSEENWGQPLIVTLTACHSWQNEKTGFFVVNAPGVQMVGCHATQNKLPGIVVSNSPGTQLIGCDAITNAIASPADVTAAGIWILGSASVTILGCNSRNDLGASQRFGITFNGDCSGSQVIGGDYQNNTVGPMSIGSPRVIVSGAAAQDVGNAFPLGASALGAGLEFGFGAPVHARPVGMLFMRTDGGSGAELYQCNGGTNWTRV